MSETEKITIDAASVSKEDRLREIDCRVTARLALFQDRRAEYLRGFFDCFYIALFLALGIYIWFSIGEEN